MSNKINLSINTQLSFASYQEAVSAQALLVRTIEAILEHPVDFNFVKNTFTVSSDITDETDSTFDQWLRKFLKSTKSDEINDRVLFEFAYLERKQGLR